MKEWAQMFMRHQEISNSEESFVNFTISSFFPLYHGNCYISALPLRLLCLELRQIPTCYKAIFNVLTEKNFHLRRLGGHKQHILSFITKIFSAPLFVYTCNSGFAILRFLIHFYVLVHFSSISSSTVQVIN